MKFTVRAGPLWFTPLVLAACGGEQTVGINDSQRPLFAIAPAQADLEEFEVCKSGSAASFNYSITLRSTGAVSTGTFNLADGGCTVLIVIGGAGADVTVTETGSAAGFLLDHVDVTTVVAPSTSTTQTGSGPTVSGTVGGSGLPGGLARGILAVYTNVAEPPPPPPPSAEGRMTGGGVQIFNNVRITRGFTIHCDLVLSNNLEINWPGNKWHLDKPLTSANCIDDPNINHGPPAAPFDTFIGEGIGRLNGVNGSLVKFTFVDAGEPGSSDMAKIQIFAPGGALVLDVPLRLLDNGNIQAHYDQPHGNKP